MSTLSSQAELSIGTIPIEKVTSVKSFGMFIDESLRWQTHIDKLSKKIAYAIGAIKRIREFVLTPEKRYETCYSLGDSGIPRTNFMKNSFSYSGAVLWNSLPCDMREAKSLSQFNDWLVLVKLVVDSFAYCLGYRSQVYLIFFLYTPHELIFYCV